LQKHEGLEQDHEHAVLLEVAEHLVSIKNTKSKKLTDLHDVVHILEVVEALGFELDALEHNEETLSKEADSVANDQEPEALYGH